MKRTLREFDALIEDFGSTMTRDDAVRLGIDMSIHECGCEVCARTSWLCPATRSSIELELLERAAIMGEA